MSARDIIRRGASYARTDFSGGGFAQDAIAGLTLAAIAVPEQMATARLGHFPPELGFLVFVAGTIGFLVFGASRTVSVGADSTITPIFAASLALAAAAGSPAYGALAAMLAIMVGVLVALAGICRMGWISNLLSAPVTTGFLAGISVHIIASQLPQLCEVPEIGGGALDRLAQFAVHLNSANPYAAGLGFGVLIVTASMERFDRKWPGALIGVAAATIATLMFGLERHGVHVLGAVASPLPRLPQTWPSLGEVARLTPLALLIAAVVMVQTAATTRSFPAESGSGPDIDRDFVGVGLGNILAGLAGSFAVNASPPRTAAVAEAGARSKRAGLIAAAGVGLLGAFGSALLTHIPNAALAGVLLFIAIRIIRIGVVRAVWRQSKAEFILILATALAMIALPLETGVGIGIFLSLLHGIWTTTRAHLIVLSRIPGTSIWWPPALGAVAQQTSGILVLAFQAPLSFLNAEAFRRGFMVELTRAPAPTHLVVLEASSIVAIDFTAAHALVEIVQFCRANGIEFALARLESVRAQDFFGRFGILDLVGRARVYRSVQEAVDALAPQSPPPHADSIAIVTHVP